MKIIDTHQHLWDPAQFSYAWLGKNPSLNRPHLMSDYFRETEGLKIEKTVFLECDIDEADIVAEARHVLALAERDDNPLSGVVAGARPEHSGFEGFLRQIQHPLLKGVRRILHVVPDDVSLTPGFLENIRLLEKYQLSFDICVLARQLPLAVRLVSECPNVQFILDHCGNPEVKEKSIETWLSDLKEVASYSNVVCKVSGIVVNTDMANWTTEDLRPYVNHVIETFGWDRVMFGSDWPVCTLATSWKGWYESLREITKDADAGNLEKLFHLNAARIYRL
jgi:predicted TIM-barrel fold metal-dependent hydrolase